METAEQFLKEKLKDYLWENMLDNVPIEKVVEVIKEYRNINVEKIKEVIHNYPEYLNLYDRRQWDIDVINEIEI